LYRFQLSHSISKDSEKITSRTVRLISMEGVSQSFCS
jgi:hypothetical protein